MSLPFGALCHLDLSKVALCQLELAGLRGHVCAMKLVGQRSYLCQKTSGCTGRGENASAIGASCHWYQVESGWGENIPLPFGALWHMDLEKVIWHWLALAEERECLTNGASCNFRPGKNHLHDWLVREKILRLVLVPFYLFSELWVVVFYLFLLFCFCFKINWGFLMVENFVLSWKESSVR